MFKKIEAIGQGKDYAPVVDEAGRQTFWADLGDMTTKAPLYGKSLIDQRPWAESAMRDRGTAVLVELVVDPVEGSVDAKIIKNTYKK